MWAQRYRDIFPRERSEPQPDTGRVRVGHYSVPREMLEEGWKLPADCNCKLCVADRRTRQ